MDLLSAKTHWWISSRLSTAERYVCSNKHACTHALAYIYHTYTNRLTKGYTHAHTHTSTHAHTHTRTHAHTHTRTHARTHSLTHARTHAHTHTHTHTHTHMDGSSFTRTDAYIRACIYTVQRETLCLINQGPFDILLKLKDCTSVTHEQRRLSERCL